MIDQRVKSDIQQFMANVATTCEHATELAEETIDAFCFEDDSEEAEYCYDLALGYF